MAPSTLLAALALALPPGDWYVAAGASCELGDGSEARPFCTIAEAIDAALDGDTIHVAAGTYVENLVLDEDLTLVGGGEVVVDGSGGFFVPTVAISGGATVVLSRLTIEGGSLAGIEIQGGKLDLEGCTLRDNVHMAGLATGGGLSAVGAEVTLVDSKVLRNDCAPFFGSPFPDGYGAGLYVAGGSLELRGCLVAENEILASEIGGGGGLYAASADVVILDSTFLDNAAGLPQPGSGGGVWCESLSGLGSLLVERSTFRGNGARSGCGVETEVPTTLRSVELSDNVGGAQVRVRATHLAAVNATVVSSRSGPVVELEDGATVLVDSSILWNVTGAPLEGVAGGSLVRYSIVRGGWGGTGNLDLDPAFVDRSAGDHRLLATSPGVDTGRPTLSSSGLDAGGVPRLLDGDLDRAPRVDMGAHEYTNLTLALSGSLAPGGSVTLDLGGSPAIATTFLAISPAPTSGLLFSRFGSLFFDPAQPLTTLALGPVPASTTLTVPSGLAPGTPVVFQAIGLAASGGGKRPGNVSNPVVTAIE